MTKSINREKGISRLKQEAKHCEDSDLCETAAVAFGSLEVTTIKHVIAKEFVRDGRLKQVSETQ